MLTPLVRRTLAPRGQTPILDAWDRRDRISAISALTLSPVRGRLGLSFDLLPANTNARAPVIVDFLRKLWRQVRGPLTVVWDRSRIHSRSKLVRAWLADHPQVQVEDFPSYAPDLNPDEGVWGWSKWSELCNVAPADVDFLRDHVWETLEKVQGRPDLLASFIRHTNLPLRL